MGNLLKLVKIFMQYDGKLVFGSSKYDKTKSNPSYVYKQKREITIIAVASIWHEKCAGIFAQTICEAKLWTLRTKGQNIISKWVRIPLRA